MLGSLGACPVKIMILEVCFFLTNFIHIFKPCIGTDYYSEFFCGEGISGLEGGRGYLGLRGGGDIWA